MSITITPESKSGLTVTAENKLNQISTWDANIDTWDSTTATWNAGGIAFSLPSKNSISITETAKV